ncbi:MAG: FHA domain-containing protein [Candidatus Brocadiae bacterium]|nr:FHA domain-containing protein [Candidatus Brocadiia bacterium]
MNELFLVSMSDENKWEPLHVETPAIIGRSQDVKITIENESVSGNHAKIFSKDGQYYLQDLGSTNKTRINMEICDEGILKDGDMVSFGSKNFLVRITSCLPRLFQPDLNRTIAIAVLPFQIGRLPSKQLSISDSSISSHHASIDQEEDRYFVKDAKSTNGTRVNGKRIQTALLQDGDKVSFGKWTALFLLEDTKKQEACLRFLCQERENEIISLQERTKIGRHEDNDVVIPKNSVSANHALIYFCQGRYWLKDLESRNGVRVCGVKVTESPLKHGDEILIGKEALLFLNPDLPKEQHYLVILSGERGGEEIPLAQPKICIGRDRSCDIFLDVQEISKRHAQIEIKEGVFTLLDLKSTNKTKVNGQPIDKAVLKHGDEIQMGLQYFIFRSSNQARPKALQEETFCLLPLYKKGYGSPVLIKETCNIGSDIENTLVLKDALVSPKHCFILCEEDKYYLCDRASKEGTWLNGQRIIREELQHGDEITVGKQTYIFKSSLQPLRKDNGEAPPAWFTTTAVAAVFLLFAFFLSSVFWKNTPVDVEKTQTAQTKKEEIKDDELLKECKEKANAYLESYQYQKALEEIELYKAKMSYISSKQKLQEEINYVQEQYKFFQEFLDSVRKSTKVLSITLADIGLCEIDKENTNLEHIQLYIPNTRERISLAWNKVPSQDFFTLMKATEFSEKNPYHAALYALEKKESAFAQSFLVHAWKNSQEEQDKHKIEALYAKALDIPMPQDGFVLYENRLVSQAEKEKLEIQKEKEKAAQKALEEQLKKEEEKEQEKLARELALQTEKEEFPMRYAILDEFVKTYSYNKAIEKFKAYSQELQTPELKGKVEERIRQIQPMADLFQKLIEGINGNKLMDNKLEISKDFSVNLVWANEEQFKVTFPQGESRYQWYSMSPLQIYQFFQKVALEAKEMYYLGVFCFENNLLQEGNQTFIKLLDIVPQSKGKIDKFLAEFLGIPIPKEGFIPHHGMLISRDEKEKRTKGFVKYRGKWVTQETKEKLEAGFILHDGKWMTPDEKKLLAGGYVQYKNKWYTPEDLENLRSNWSEAWTKSSENYDLKTNIGKNYIEELTLFMEGSYQEYKRIFDLPAKKRMKVFAFKNYEDYRSYCLSSGNAAQVRAGGFATSRDLIGVAWMRNSHKDLMEKLIHEGAHLYHFNSCPNLNAPSWFAEAVATQFEGYQWDGKKVKVDCLSRSRLLWLQRKILDKRYIPIDKMMHGNALEYINKDPEEAATFYAQSWGLYYYLWRHTEKDYQTRFQNFVIKMNKGQYSGREEKAFLKEFESDIPVLETGWKKYMLHLK